MCSPEQGHPLLRTHTVTRGRTLSTEAVRSVPLSPSFIHLIMYLCSYRRERTGSPFLKGLKSVTTTNLMLHLSSHGQREPLLDGLCVLLPHLDHSLITLLLSGTSFSKLIFFFSCRGRIISKEPQFPSVATGVWEPGSEPEDCSRPLRCPCFAFPSVGRRTYTPASTSPIMMSKYSQTRVGATTVYSCALRGTRPVRGKQPRWGQKRHAGSAGTRLWEQGPFRGGDLPVLGGAPSWQQAQWLRVTCSVWLEQREVGGLAGDGVGTGTRGRTAQPQGQGAGKGRRERQGLTSTGQGSLGRPTDRLEGPGQEPEADEKVPHAPRPAGWPPWEVGVFLRQGCRPSCLLGPRGNEGGFSGELPGWPRKQDFCLGRTTAGVEWQGGSGTQESRGPWA